MPIAVILGLVVLTPANVRAIDAPAIAAGKALAANGGGGAPPCGSCHGADGGGRAGMPRLAGLDAAYIRAQLTAFATGSRENATMEPIAKTMNAEAIATSAAYYASLPAPAAMSPAAPAAQVAVGATLADRGRWSGNVPPCSSCHGKDGLGVGSAFPPVAGQPAAYIAGQLKAWKAGTRHDDPLALMHAVASRLGDDEVAAVAAYYATLPSAAPTRGDAR